MTYKNNIVENKRLLPMLIMNIYDIGKESIMLSIPSAAKQIFMSISIAFTQPTYQRILPLAGKSKGNIVPPCAARGDEVGPRLCSG